MADDIRCREDRGRRLKPIDEKLLRIDPSSPDGWALVAQRCGDCETIFHPVRYRCPRCGSAALADVDLEKTGTIQTLTRVLQTSPESMISVPYYLALIQMDSGPLIEAVSASELGEADISAGSRVTLLLEVLDKDEDGDGIAAYRFSTSMAMKVTK